MSAPSFAAIAPDRLAVVTPAAGGIGLAAACALADAGMRVVLVDPYVLRLAGPICLQ